MAGLLSIEEAQRLILERVSPRPIETVPLALAVGRALAEDARAAVDLPPFASSAMDGYAVRSADAPGRLAVVDESAAGRPATRTLGTGEAIAIATGAVVPEGADAVVPIEDVVVEGTTVHIAAAVDAAANIRPRGGDARADAVVVRKGSLVGASQVGALAAAGVVSVEVHRRARAAVLATGTELRRPGESLGPGQIYEANSAMLVAQLASAGAEAEQLEAVADDADAHRAAIGRGLALDVLVTSGGVSVGPHDLVRRIEAELGVEEVFWGVSVRPGKPVSFGVYEDTLVFGLPGNPDSSLVAFELFVRPALDALHGVARPLPRFLPGRLAAAVRRAPRVQLLRARLREDGTLEPITGQESHMIARAAEADALVLVPDGEGELVAGSDVRFLAL